ncbi:thiamine phosphate synthase [Halapricum hydrolyticum]|uniref:Thiamine-phosphate synthase n=1 Tax=Halapricum hydrolyticum TaxID=2979991 RepID=A0AAE3IGF9_9EURY|nr:thiamine phosphate synthase [Halapricum hydrolyticum]MCU4719522.1 thiamine phosphate synthase [Halapricum hydrolyticum]MCU4728194.1 thiamine phosphate synthase [Halapricum hydrolyticum]
MTDWDVYLVTQASLSEGRDTREIVRAAVDGGVDVVQLREKGVPARERYELGVDLREITREAGVPLIVNDRVDIAQAVQADGVHLGDEDLPVTVARELLGEDAIVGRSVSFVEDAREAERAGADYLGVGAIYATGSKDDIDDEEYAIGLDRLESIVEAVEIPVVGIGGVDADNASEVAAAGADGVAVISAITGAGDPAAATRELSESVRSGRGRSE